MDLSALRTLNLQNTDRDVGASREQIKGAEIRRRWCADGANGANGWILLREPASPPFAPAL